MGLPARRDRGLDERIGHAGTSARLFTRQSWSQAE